MKESCLSVSLDDSCVYGWAETSSASEEITHREICMGSAVKVTGIHISSSRKKIYLNK